MPGQFGPFEPWFFYGVAAVEIVMIAAFGYAIIKSIIHRKQVENHAWWLITSVFLIMMPALGRGIQNLYVSWHIKEMPNVDIIGPIYFCEGLILLMILLAAFKYKKLKHPAMSAQTIFITGGAGFIGNRVVKFLLERNYKVSCLVRSFTNTRRLDGLEYEKCIGDITDKQSLIDGMKGCAGVIHLAGLSNWIDIHSPKLPQVVIEGSRNVLAAARVNGNIKTVFVSSSTAIDGTDDKKILDEEAPFTLPANKHFAYAHAKNKVEQYCKECSANGQPITIVNPTEVYGPFDYDKITSGNLIDFANTSTVKIAKGGTSIVHVDDVAMGIIAAFEKGRSGERYILGSDNLEIEELARTTLEILGMNKPVKFLSRGLLMNLAWVSRTFRINMGFEPAVIPYAVKYWFMDNSKAKNELGIHFRPAKEILKPTLDWLLEEGLIR